MAIDLLGYEKSDASKAPPSAGLIADEAAKVKQIRCFAGR